MLKLFCAVVGKQGSAFSVEIDASESVGDLRNMIRDHPQFGHPNSKMELFLAKKGGTWLPSSNLSVITMRSGVIPDDIKQMLTQEIDRADEIGDLFAQCPTKKVIHVLVVVSSDEPPNASPPHAAGINIPDQTEPLSKKAKIARNGVGYHGLLLDCKEAGWKWKTEEEPVDSLENDNMYFVNRDRAVLQLQEIHKQKYNRAVNGAGLAWIIPIADNAIGLGKSSFGTHYIRKCRGAWKDVDNKSDFHKTVSECHTVRLIFDRGDLLKPSLDAVMLDFLVQELHKMFEKPPDILSNPPETTKMFLEQLTREVGPLFIELDGIGAAFDADNLDHVQSRPVHGVLPQYCWKVVIDEQCFLRASWAWIIFQLYCDETHPDAIHGESVHLFSTEYPPSSTRSDQDKYGEHVCR